MKPKQEFVKIPAGEVEVEGKMVKVESFQISNLCVTRCEYLTWIVESGIAELFEPLSKPNRPMTNVSWFEANRFAAAHNCRLPTEAEWQWAAQGGELEQIWAGTSEEAELSKFAWFGDFGRITPHRVGKLLPNSFGLYDMSGNVWEWCEDLYNQKGSIRVLRGGGWFGGARGCRSANRDGARPEDRGADAGFRLVFVP